VCVAPLAQVVHQAQTVQSVSLVNQGLLTRLLPHKLVNEVNLSILLLLIPNKVFHIANPFTYHPLGLLYIHPQNSQSVEAHLLAQLLSIYQSLENDTIPIQLYHSSSSSNTGSNATAYQAPLLFIAVCHNECHSLNDLLLE